MTERNEKKVVGVRLEDFIRTLLADKAKENSRSLSGEIAHRVRKSLEVEGASNGHQA